jgi:Lamin Tail Domain
LNNDAAPHKPAHRRTPHRFAPSRATAISRIIALLTCVAVWAVASPALAANPTLHFSKAYVNSPGSDTGTNTSLNAEYVVISNASYSTSYKLTGYTLRDRSGHVYKFPTFTLRTRASVTVHTGRGTNTGTNLYWGSSAYIWNNSGDAAYLKNTAGTLKDSCSWGSVSSYVTC